MNPVQEECIVQFLWFVIVLYCYCCLAELDWERVSKPFLFLPTFEIKSFQQ